MARRKRLIPPNSLSDVPEGSLENIAMPFGRASRAAATNSGSGQGGFSTAPMAPVARVAGDQAQAAALRELSEEMTRAREGGRIVLELPIEAIEAEHLTRDRLTPDESEMESLKESLTASGQRTPIEVLDLGSGRYGLISGWRRLTALRTLASEGRAGPTVLALLRRPEDQAAAYRAMVEENEIRADLSYYERARIVAKTVEAGIFEDDRAALQGLFGAASRARRSKIGSFLPIVRALDGALRYPSALPERLGLKLSQALREDDTLEGRLRDALAEESNEPDAERALLEAAANPGKLPRPIAKREKPTVEAGQGAARIVLTRDRSGRLIIEGPGATEDFADRLRAWVDEGAR